MIFTIFISSTFQEKLLKTRESHSKIIHKLGLYKTTNLNFEIVTFLILLSSNATCMFGGIR